MLIEIGKQYLSAMEAVNKAFREQLPTDLVRAVVHRTQLHNHAFTYLEKHFRMLFTHQYNHLMQQDTEATIRLSNASRDIAIATQKDSMSMKTVAYLTFVFLPVNFVSAIFSTTVFDFQNWAAFETRSKVVSPGWWVFLLSCIVVTAVTFIAWYWWHSIGASEAHQIDRVGSQRRRSFRSENDLD